LWQSKAYLYQLISRTNDERRVWMKSKQPMDSGGPPIFLRTSAARHGMGPYKAAE
jgi:hypothetical protein